MANVEEFLEHHGIKGMKWGIRNRSRKSNKLGPSKDYKKAASASKKVKKGSVKALTNKELKEFNTRFELEKKYREINPSKAKKGHSAVKEVLAVGATVNTAIMFAKSPAGKHVANTIKKRVTKL